MNRLAGLMVVFVFTGCASAQPAATLRSSTTSQTPTAVEDPSLVQRYQQTITADKLAAHLFFVASDLLEGRDTASRGQRIAAHYLAAQYQKMGVQPAGTTHVVDPRDPRSYFQTFQLKEEGFREAALHLVAGTDTLSSSHFSLRHQDGFSYLAGGSDTHVSGGVVFAGYGIADDELGYNDFEALAENNISLADQWVLILRDEPLANDSTSLLPTQDRRPSAATDHAWRKMSAAYAHAGAQNSRPAGFLVVSDVGPRVTGSTAQQASEAARVWEMQRQVSSPGDSRIRRAAPPVFHISSTWADKLLEGSGRTIASVQQQIDQTLVPVVFEVPEVHVHGTVTFDSGPVETENVLALIEGSDPDLKHEVVILTAHYDHVGIDPTLPGDQIHNGADDNGSGTVAMLEIAEAFALAAAEGYRPRRSVLFLHVSAEEKGLLGSAYYADEEPVFPLEHTVTNLNMDMIGRFDPTHPTGSENYVYIIGSNLISQELHDLNAAVNDLTGTRLELDERFNDRNDPNQFYRRSDQWNFGKHGIPFIFYFTGTHEDYHAPGDEAHKIEYERMARIARLVFATTWQVANQDERPAVSGTGFN